MRGKPKANDGDIVDSMGVLLTELRPKTNGFYEIIRGSTAGLTILQAHDFGSTGEIGEGQHFPLARMVHIA